MGMNENDKIYFSLDEAREELKKRWADTELRKKVEAELGENFIPNFGEKKRAVLTRQICSPDNGFTFFHQCAHYVNAEPYSWEFQGDIFTHLNEEKKGYGRLRLTLEDGTKATVDIMDFHANEKKPLGEAVLKTGEKLVDFHHNLLKNSGYPIDLQDNTNWFRNIGHAADYYYPLLLHFVAHGVLFETFFDEEDSSENTFTNSIVYPAIEKIKNKFGLTPIILRLYPQDQTDEEDFYWWSYPPEINDQLIKYAKKSQLLFKNVE
jgi:hypothetical protein